MARVTVLMHTTLKKALGKGKDRVKAENIAEVMDALEKKFGDKFRDEVYEGDKIKSYYIFLLNGDVVDSKELAETSLKKGDMVHIFTPIPGG